MGLYQSAEYGDTRTYTRLHVALSIRSDSLFPDRA